MMYLNLFFSILLIHIQIISSWDNSNPHSNLISALGNHDSYDEITTLIDQVFSESNQNSTDKSVFLKTQVQFGHERELEKDRPYKGPQILQYLIGRGANANAQYNNNNTPLTYVLLLIQTRIPNVYKSHNTYSQITKSEEERLDIVYNNIKKEISLLINCGASFKEPADQIKKYFFQLRNVLYPDDFDKIKTIWENAVNARKNKLARRIQARFYRYKANNVSLHELAFKQLKNPLLNNMQDPRYPDFFEIVETHTKTKLLKNFTHNYKKNSGSEDQSSKNIKEFPLYPKKKSDIFLHRAIEDDQPAVIEYLLTKGFSTNIKDKYDQTPAHFAAQFNSEKTMKLLIATGADINAKNSFDETPLDRAAKNTTTYQMLHDAGAQYFHEL